MAKNLSPNQDEEKISQYHLFDLWLNTDQIASTQKSFQRNVREDDNRDPK